jgi:glycosyltransferase involved in cell wall biosynthesis
MPVPWLIVAGDFSLGGGMDKANYHLAWYLADRLGRHVTLVAHRVAEPLARHANVTVVTVPRPRGLHLLGMPLLDRAGRRAAARLTAAHPGARVLVNGGNCRWPAASWVHMVHHACPARDAGAPAPFRLRNRLTRWLFRRDEARRLPMASLLIANSERTRRDLVERVGVDPDRIRVVYLGSDGAATRPVSAAEREEARRRLGLDPAAPVLLFVGALGYDRNKGLDTLLACGRLLASRGMSEAVILAAGDGRLDFWRREAAAHGVAERTRFLGRVDDVPALLAAADLLVSPTRYDAYGLAVHEALCRGRAAIVSRAAGVSERYPPELAALLLNDPDSADELASRIADWFARRDALQPAIDRLAADLRSRTWDDVAAEIVTLVESAA